MKNISIRNHKTNGVIFNGNFKTLREAVEAAVSQNISLAYADLRRARLDNANLDGGDFRFAVLDGATLIGANMSETDITGASLRGTDLTGVCLCESRIVDADFTGAVFGGTLLAGAAMDNCIFTCASALALPFIEARLGRNILEIGGKVATFAGAPIVITGLPKRIALLDTVVVIGDTAYPRKDLPTDLMAHLRDLCLRAVG